MAVSNLFRYVGDEQRKEVESMFRLAASHFGGRVTLDAGACGNVSFTGGSAQSVEDDVTGFNRFFVTSLVNRYIAGKAEPELEIKCDKRGGMTFHFLKPSAKGSQPV